MLQAIRDFVKLEAASGMLLFDERLGIIAGSLLSGVAACLLLRFTLPDRTRTK
jgi:hypothetical protein